MENEHPRLPIQAGAELHRARTARPGDLTELRRGWAGIPDVKERVIQESILETVEERRLFFILLWVWRGWRFR